MLADPTVRSNPAARKSARNSWAWPGCPPLASHTPAAERWAGAMAAAAGATSRPA